MRAVNGILAFGALLFSADSAACWSAAAEKYGLNPYLLYAIARTESGLNPEAVNHNRNGSYDLGLMQINSLWFPTLRKYGVSEKDLLDPCVNLNVGAWILAQNLRKMGNSWTAVGAYNANNPEARLRYALKVYRNLPPIAFVPASNEPLRAFSD